jgi:hypothetical protein
MKKIYSIIIAILFSSQLFAQAPNKMSYQAVIRNSSNALVVSKSIGMQVSILQGSVTGTSVYVERQTPTTNTNGLASIEIGTGTIVSGSFSTINWANGPYFIKTETDVNGGTTYTISGTSELMSVPFALHAKTASNLLNYYDADTSATNELQTLSISKDTLYLSKGGNVKLPYHYDADTSATNELQILTISNDTIFLSNGGYVKLPIASSSGSNLPIPSIVTNPILGVTSNSATYSGRVTNANGSVVIERGIVYSTSPNPNIYFNSGKITIGKDTGLFNITTTMSANDGYFLQPNNTYYVRAYAITENNITKYGNQVTFTTLNLTPPTVSTQAVTNITPFSAKFNGTLTNTNGNLVLTRGFVVSTNANPTLHPNYLNQYRNTGSDVWVADASNTSGSNFTEFKHWTGLKQGGGVGIFNSDSINRNYQIPFFLIPNTQYYVRSFAFAENNTVTYGNQVSFTTLTVITTSPVSGITSNSATFGAIIINVDTNLILSRGVKIGNSTDQLNTILEYTGNFGSGVFSKTTSLRIYDELLIPNTVYYFRAYVELNGMGTLLGRMDSFTTLPVGQTGPGGGKVFFDKGNTAGGWRYLMAAPSDQSTGITWGCDTSLNQISGTLQTVGSGETNTSLIVSACSGMNAAKLCDNLVLGGQNDWFLPSIDELYLMYKNLHLNSTGSFVNDENYWSSSANDYLAERFTFYSSNFGTGSTMRNTQLRVRAVRAY